MNFVGRWVDMGMSIEICEQDIREICGHEYRFVGMNIDLWAWEYICEQDTGIAIFGLWSAMLIGFSFCFYRYSKDY